MKTEIVTTPPPTLTPEMRYASLHRTIENGMASDRTWLELVQVCIEMRRRSEARDAYEHIKDPPMRRRGYNSLIAAGVPVEAPSSELAAKPTVELDRAGVLGLVDWVADGFRFLFLDHMPLTTIVATVTFPLVVGIGGFLSAGHPGSWFLPLIALIPALSVIGLVGALGRRILTEASQGLDDAPEIPVFSELVREAGRFLVDAAVLCAVFLGPGLALTQLSEVGTSAILAALAVGGSLLPMALAMRQTQNDWNCLSPMDLFDHVRRAGTRYFAAVGVAFVLLGPAAISVALTSGSALYMMLSVVGPLLVVPIFVTSRLFGQTIIPIERERAQQALQVKAVERLAAERVTSEATPAAAAPRVRLRAASGTQAHPESQVAPTPTTARAPARAQSPAPAPAPVATPPRATRAPSTQARPAPGNTPGGSVGLRSDRAVQPSATPRSAAPAEPRPAPAAIRTNNEPPAPRLRARPEAAAPAAPTPPPQRFRGAQIASVVGEEMPDLTKMPGVSVLRGKARIAAGAAAPIRPQD